LGKKESPLVEISGNVNGEAPISPPTIRVLVIDDDAGDREQVRRSFAAHGGVGLFEIVECSDPGVLHDDLIRSAQIFVVDLDLGTADVDGFDVLDRIRQARGESARIFVCSNRTDSESVSRVLKAGATAFLAKPFSFAGFIKHGLGV
jgi:DNA-binding response OmpR family regulator